MPNGKRDVSSHSTAAAWIALALGLGSACYLGREAIGSWLGSDSAPAWVQAVGSIAAILAAVWLGHRTDSKAAQGAKNHLLMFMASTRSAIGSTLQACQDYDRIRLGHGRALLFDAVQLGQMVPIHLLTRQKALVAIRYRAAVSTAAALADHQINAGWERQEFNHLAGELLSLLEELGKVDA